MQATVVPLETAKDKRQKNSNSSSSIYKILACVFFVTTIGFAVGMGIAMSSEDKDSSSPSSSDCSNSIPSDTIDSKDVWIHWFDRVHGMADVRRSVVGSFGPGLVTEVSVYYFPTEAQLLSRAISSTPCGLRFVVTPWDGAVSQYHINWCESDSSRTRFFYNKSFVRGVRGRGARISILSLTLRCQTFLNINSLVSLISSSIAIGELEYEY